MEFDNEFEQDSDLSINILPMIDVLFAVLLFFVISSLILNRNSMTGINRPQTNISTPIDKEAIIVSANKKGEIYINKIKSDQSTLAEDLGSIQKEVKNNVSTSESIRSTVLTSKYSAISVL